MMTPDAFAALHRPGRPFVLPNVWDLASARWLAARGHEVVGTTSLGVAVEAGLPDGAGLTADATLRLATDLTAAGLGVTVDIESGFSDDPAAVADYARRLRRLGVLGVNLEDSDTTGVLVDPLLTAAKVEAVAAAAPELFINARTDAFWIDRSGSAAEREELAVTRAALYVSAGAAGVFVPGAMPLALIARLAAQVGAPLNVLAQAGLSLDELAGARVARISTGSLLFRSALGAIEDALARVRDPSLPAPVTAIPSYGEVAALS